MIKKVRNVSHFYPFLSVSMSLKEMLHSLRRCVAPPLGKEQRIWSRITVRTSVPVARDLRNLMTVPRGCQQSIWARVQEQLTFAPSLFGNVRFVKWGAGVVLAMFVLKLMPAFFVATPSAAESRVMVFPTRGEVSLSSGEAGWANLAKEVVLNEHSVIRTRDGEATVVLHDDGVVRLAPYTAIELHDLSDRPVGLPGPTLTLIHGKIWVQGLLPTHVEPLHIAFSYGDVLIHDGSVSVEEGSTVMVSVWDRRAVVIHDKERLPLVAGERTWLWERNIPTVQRVVSEGVEQQWIAQNLDRDAVHRQDIALREREENLKIAGILPTSSLYSIKRAAEDLDMFLTFGKEAKVKKQLEQASRRLNEAAAMIVKGEEAESLLVEYRDVLQTLGVWALENDFKELIAQVLREDTASIAAAFPGEEGYLLKHAVLEVAATVGSGGNIQVTALEGVLLGDAVLALTDHVRSGQVGIAEDGFAAIGPFIDSVLGAEDLEADLRKELHMLLSDLAQAVQKRRNVVGDINGSFYQGVMAYLPSPGQPVVIQLTDGEVQEIAHRIFARVLDTFTMRRSRENQLWTEIKALRGHPDRARILRRLYQEFADEPWYAAYVREEMKFLREERGLL